MYPNADDAPEELKVLSGPCGPISMWMVLKRYGIDAPPTEIVSSCRYTEEYGSFLVCMADALQQFGLHVQFYSDRDPAPKQLEQEAYSRVSRNSALPLPKLLRAVDAGASVIVSYLARGGEGHFSPLAGAKVNKLLLPNSAKGKMLKSEFIKRWGAPEILRQSLIATSKQGRMR